MTLRRDFEEAPVRKPFAFGDFMRGVLIGMCGHLECMTAAVQRELLAAAEEIETTLTAPSAVVILRKRAELPIRRETHNGSNHNETV